MSSLISMLMSAVVGCGLCVAAAAGVTQVANTAAVEPIQRTPVVEYGNR